VKPLGSSVSTVTLVERASSESGHGIIPTASMRHSVTDSVSTAGIEDRDSEYPLVYAHVECE
jgi:hypothetical protein